EKSNRNRNAAHKDRPTSTARHNPANTCQWKAVRRINRLLQPSRLAVCGLLAQPRGLPRPHSALAVRSWPDREAVRSAEGTEPAPEDNGSLAARRTSRRTGATGWV